MCGHGRLLVSIHQFLLENLKLCIIDSFLFNVFLSVSASWKTVLYNQISRDDQVRAKGVKPLMALL
jgi:hypothetical protein